MDQNIRQQRIILIAKVYERAAMRTDPSWPEIAQAIIAIRGVRRSQDVSEATKQNHKSILDKTTPKVFGLARTFLSKTPYIHKLASELKRT